MGTGISSPTGTRTGLSLAEQLASLGQPKVEQFFRESTKLDLAALEYDWSFWERPNQRPPAEHWSVWLLQPGRGFGKTRIGAETVRAWAKVPGTRIALGGKAPADYIGTMVNGEAGILSRCPPWDQPKWFPSHSPPELIWENGSRAFCYSGEEPDSLRGPAHHKAWVDELAKFKYPDEFWSNLQFGMRLGDAPQTIVTTTPQPIRLIRDLVKLSKQAGSGVVLTRGSTHENLAYLSPAFKQMVLDRYEGTRLGRQEIYGELLEDTPGALWTMAVLEANRRHDVPALERVVVAVDPSANDGNDENLDECGIVCAGLDPEMHGNLLDDETMHGSPLQWAKRAIALYHRRKADLLVAEANNGGEMVRTVIHSLDNTVPVKLVHASRGKWTRAEPISTLDERGKLHLVGHFKELEDELTTWVPGQKSPNRLDAYVWAFTELLGLYRAFEADVAKGEDAAPVPVALPNRQEVDPAVLAMLRF